MVAKTRPVLVLSVAYNDQERALVTYVPRTTSVRKGARFEVAHEGRGFDAGAFDAQGVATVPCETTRLLNGRSRALLRPAFAKA
jgi:mRNA interferase MazF